MIKYTIKIKKKQKKKNNIISEQGHLTLIISENV